LIAPPFIVYNENFEALRSCFDILLNQSCLDVKRSSRIRDFFASVISARTEAEFFHPDAIEKLIKSSGGIFRDLIGLAQSSIENAYGCGADKVIEQHADEAIRDFGYSQLMTVNPSHYPLLHQMILDHENARKPSLIDGILPLLRSQKILEYTYPRRRYAVHPSIQAVWSEFMQEVY